MYRTSGTPGAEISFSARSESGLFVPEADLHLPKTPEAKEILPTPDAVTSAVGAVALAEVVTLPKTTELVGYSDIETKTTTEVPLADAPAASAAELASISHAIEKYADSKPKEPISGVRLERDTVPADMSDADKADLQAMQKMSIRRITRTISGSRELGEDRARIRTLQKEGMQKKIEQIKAERSDAKSEYKSAKSDARVFSSERRAQIKKRANELRQMADAQHPSAKKLERFGNRIAAKLQARKSVIEKLRAERNAKHDALSASKDVLSEARHNRNKLYLSRRTLAGRSSGPLSSLDGANKALWSSESALKEDTKARLDALKKKRDSAAARRAYASRPVASQRKDRRPIYGPELPE